MDRCQILLAYFSDVLHIALLHLLRHDDCGCDTKPPYCCHNRHCVFRIMESIFRIHRPKTRKYFPIQKKKNHFSLKQESALSFGFD
jgi:hypothetical protein